MVKVKAVNIDIYSLFSHSASPYSPPKAACHRVGALQKKCRTHCSAELASIVPAGKYTVPCVYFNNTAFSPYLSSKI